MVYYEILEDGSIGKSTTSKEIVEYEKFINIHETENEDDIIYGYDGKRYLKGNEPTIPNYIFNQQKIAELKQKLSDTDYITNKLAEAISKYIIIEDKTPVSQILTEYSEELQQREQWRDEINKLEESILKLN